MKEKIVVYQVFTRLFGNDCLKCVPNGDKDENGCGKLAHFTPKALKEIRALGATHIWYTGVIEHATQTDYSEYGIAVDCPSIVKGKAGSPYAIKDYYDVDPDLATDIPDRMKEFCLLVKRTHKAGLRVITDFVPNHVARQYHSDACPDGVRDLGEDDNVMSDFSLQNNFYYLPGEEFRPQFDVAGYREYPAKATGNDVFHARPCRNDWYETVKLNYGVHYTAGKQGFFWPIPSTWHKMLDILLFWAEKGTDGFRCDMAEMVPVEFWGWVIPQVKARYPEVIFIAEVYNPSEYRNYIFRGCFDYLYDKVGLYDTLRAVTCGHASAQNISHCWQSVDDIKNHMLNFLENHDEQRLASDFYAGNGKKGRAPLLVSALMGQNPMMVYFGQEFGERGMDEEGFSGRDGRTTIFDYWAVDTVRRWRNKGRFDDKQLTAEECSLRDFYSKVLTLCNEVTALREGDFYDLMYVNPHLYHQYVFLRRAGDEIVLVIANFDDVEQKVQIHIPLHVFQLYNIGEVDNISTTDLLTGNAVEIAFNSVDAVSVAVPPLNGTVLQMKISVKSV